MMQSESIKELATALSTAQAEIAGAKKDKENPFFHSHYADLASVWDACRKPLSENGLAVVQMPSTQRQPGEGGEMVVEVKTKLLHTSGEWMECSLSAEVKDGSPQVIGSAITYLRRYALSAMVGVAPEDDDAEKAMGRNGKPPIAQPTAKSKGAPAQGDTSTPPKEGKPQVQNPVVVGKVQGAEKIWEGKTTSGNPSKLYAIKLVGGLDYKTFSSKKYGVASEALKQGIPVRITYKEGPKGNEIQTIEPHEEN